MSGHSKWSTIKRKKGAADAKRGQAFTKLTSAITLAAKEGGGQPETNLALRLAVDRARAANMPTAGIDRAIKRGTGELAGVRAPEQVTYEVYGAGGVAILVDCLTDNRNRTVSAVRSLVTKHGARLGQTNSVAYLFTKKGVMTIGKDGVDSDRLMLAAVDAGASDVADVGNVIEIETDQRSFAKVRQAIEAAGFTVDTAELANVAQASLPISDAKLAGSIVKLVTALEDLDDVVAVATNADIEPELVAADG